MIEHIEDQVLVKIKNGLPHVHEQIKDIIVCEEEIRLSVAKNIDVPNVERFVGGKWNSLYSKFNPLDEAEKWASSIEGTPKHIILFGFGLGYHYQALKRKFSKATFHIVEPDPQLFLLYVTLLGGSLKKALHNVEHFLLSGDKVKYHTFFENMMNFINEDWLILSVPKHGRIYQDDFQNYLTAFKKAKEKYKKQMYAQYSFEKVWNVNVLKNLPYIYKTPNIFEYQNNFEGKSVIVTASGPSLDDSIPFLQQMKASKKVIIVAAGTSVNALVSKGVEPDLFVSYDPFEANYKNLKGSLHGTIPFVFGSTIYSDIPSEYKGPMAHMIISQDTIMHYLDSSIRKDKIIDDAPTITAVTLDLLYKLKVKDIYLVGQDLCFINNKSQAENVYVLNKKGEILKSQLKGKQYVENNAGLQAETNQSFLNMKEFIEEKVEGYKGIKIYTLSLYGAKLNGIDFCSYDDISKRIDKNKEINLTNFLPIEADTKKLLSDIRNIKEQIYFFKAIAETLHRQYIRFQQATNSQKEKWRNKVDSTLDRLINHFSYSYLIYPFIVNRVNYMMRLRTNLEFTSIVVVEEYYKRGLLPFINELELTLRMYDEILINPLKLR
jgi:hypothetical protein